MKFSLQSIAIFTSLLLTTQAMACTGITVKTKDGSVISSRTMEFAFALDSKVIYLPRNFKVDAIFTDGKKGASWKQKYAVVGLNGLNQNIIIEGFNEKGLSVGAFYLPGYAAYSKLTSDNASKALSSAHVPTWIAGNFATVEEVKAGLKNMIVVDNALQGVNFPLPLHYRVTDPTGAEIIIEYVKEGLKVYDNKTGVITNSPEFNWHLTNLNNFTNVSATNVPKVELPGLNLISTSEGSGMHGLPGDFTSPSRFVRVFAIQVSAIPVETADEGVNLSWHIINNIDIPVGAARDKDENGNEYLNRTQWVNVSDLKNLKMYLRTYNNPIIRMVDLKKMNTESPDLKTIAIDVKPEFMDITNNSN